MSFLTCHVLCRQSTGHRYDPLVAGTARTRRAGGSSGRSDAFDVVALGIPRPVTPAAKTETARTRGILRATLVDTSGLRATAWRPPRLMRWRLARGRRSASVS